MDKDGVIKQIREYLDIPGCHPNDGVEYLVTRWKLGEDWGDGKTLLEQVDAMVLYCVDKCISDTSIDHGDAYCLMRVIGADEYCILLMYILLGRCPVCKVCRQTGLRGRYSIECDSSAYNPNGSAVREYLISHGNYKESLFRAVMQVIPNTKLDSAEAIATAVSSALGNIKDMTRVIKTETPLKNDGSAIEEVVEAYLKSKGRFDAIVYAFVLGCVKGIAGETPEEFVSGMSDALKLFDETAREAGYEKSL